MFMCLKKSTVVNVAFVHFHVMLFISSKEQYLDVYKLMFNHNRGYLNV